MRIRTMVSSLYLKYRNYYYHNSFLRKQQESDVKDPKVFQIAANGICLAIIGYRSNEACMIENLRILEIHLLRSFRQMTENEKKL